MLRISLAGLVTIYLCVFLAAVSAVWIIEERRRQRRARRALQDRVYCTVCAYDFEDATSDPLPVCPRCGTKNDRPRSNRL